MTEADNDSGDSADASPAASAGEEGGAFSRIPRPLRAVLPWILAGGILWWLFREIPIADSWEAARNAELGLFTAAALASVAAWFFLESRAFAYLFSRFNAPVSWKEARSLRGLTYLVTPINWNLGTATVILHLRRSKGISAIDSASSMIFYSMLDGLVLAGLVLLGMLQLPPSPETLQVRNGAAFVVATQIATLIFLATRTPDWRWLQVIRELRIFRTHSRAAARDFALLGSIRCCYFATFVLFFWVGTRAFGVEVPFFLVTAATPLILLAGALPITPAGLGTQQAAMLYFFSPYGDSASILAFGLAFPVAVTLGRMAFGLVYLGDLAALRRSAALREV